MFIQPEDIVYRLRRRKRHWFHGKPTILVRGEEYSFGVLEFNFSDSIESFGIWIINKSKILDVANEAIENFDEILWKLFEE